MHRRTGKFTCCHGSGLQLLSVIESIGLVVLTTPDLPGLKRASLIFDRFVLWPLFSGADASPEYISDLDFLREQHVLVTTQTWPWSSGYVEWRHMTHKAQSARL